VQDDRQSSNETEARQRSASNGGVTDGERVESSAMDAADAGTESDEQAGRPDTVTTRAGDVGRRLKPVAAAAETVASYGVHLSALGLQRVDDFLKERRERRQEAAGKGAANEATPTSLDPSMIPGSVDETRTSTGA
jgi:hypothetical protein